MVSVNEQVKGIVVTANGDAAVLQMGQFALGAPAPGQALINVKAAGLNFIDVYQRIGRDGYAKPLPYTPGLEGSGVVEAIGPSLADKSNESHDNHGIKVGDRVAYNGNLGAYAEHALVKTEDLIPLPDEMSFEQGAAFPLQGMTAHYLLHEFRQVKSGEAVLVHAAAGGMGLLLCQWLKHKGALVIGTTSSHGKAELARTFGCDYTINYNEQDFVQEVMRITDGQGCPIVIDGVGKTTFPGSLEAVAKRGSVIIFGSASGPADPIAPNALQKKSVTVSGGSLFNYLDSREELLRRANDVLSGIKQGWLKLNISTVLPLAHAAEAHRLLESRGSTGKIILSCE